LLEKPDLLGLKAKNLASYIASQKKSGASSPSVPPPSTSTPVSSIIPDPTVYEGESAQALQAYQSALAAISQRRAGTLQNYGMTAQVDPNGNLTNYGIDPNNPYGAIQQLLDQEGSQLTGLQHASVDRGIGTSGLGAQDISQARFQGGQNQLNLGRQFVGEIGQEASDQYGANSSYNQAKLQAQRDAIVSAIQNSYFTPTPQSSGTQPAPLATTTTTPTKTTKTTKAPVYQRTSLAKNMGVGL